MKTHVFFGILVLVAALLAYESDAAVVEGNIYTLYLDLARDAIVRVNSVPEQIKVAKDGRYSFELPPGAYVLTATLGDDGDFFAEENVTIKGEGTYNIDIIMIPVLDSMDEDDEFFEEIEKDYEVGVVEKTTRIGLYVTAVVIIIVLIGLLYMHRLMFKKERVYEGKERGEEKGEKKEEIFEERKDGKQGKEEKAEKAERGEREGGRIDGKLDIDLEKIKSEAEEQLEKLVEYIKTEGGRVTQKDIRKKFPFSEAKISLMIAELEDKGVLKKIKRGRGNIIILK